MTKFKFFCSAIFASITLLAGCGWIYPSENLRAVPSDLAIPQFEEIPVEFSHRWDRDTSHHLSGAAVIDIDADGHEEIFVGGGANQTDVLLGLRDGRLVDRIVGTGLVSEGTKSSTYGVSAIDLDADGDVDLVVARDDGVTIYVNHGGFFKARRLQVDLPINSVPLAVAISDIDHDGDGDLYLSNFVDFPHFKSATFNVPEHAKSNRLLRNDGDWQFTDITDPVTASKQNTFASSFVDLDGDRFDDLVIAQNTGQVEILRNLHDGHFESVPYESGYGFWMGVAAGDFDADGDQDLIFTNVGDSFPAFIARGDRRDNQPYAGGWLLLRNDGGFHFTDITRDAGLDGLGFAWGPVFEDINLDGKLDLLVSQNYIKWPFHRFVKFPGKVLLGDGTQFYPAAVAENPAYSNSPVIADLDGDGRPDVFWLNNDSPSSAYLNRNNKNRISVSMPDSVSLLGALVWLEGTDIPDFTREVVSASGLGTDQSPRLTFGLGDSTRVDRLVVSWTDGTKTIVESPVLNQIIRIDPPDDQYAGRGNMDVTDKISFDENHP